MTDLRPLPMTAEDWHHRCDIAACNCGRCHQCGVQMPTLDAARADTEATEAACVHDAIRVFREAGEGPGRMWACSACHRRFYPACPICVTVGHRGAHAAAARAALARVRERVEGLPAYEEHDEAGELDIYDPTGIRRAAVLAILDEEAAR